MHFPYLLIQLTEARPLLLGKTLFFLFGRLSDAMITGIYYSKVTDLLNLNG